MSRAVAYWLHRKHTRQLKGLPVKGFSNVSGNIYSVTISGMPTGVKFNGAVLTRNTASPSAPTASQWGLVGRTLYVNVGAAPSSGQLLVTGL
jgi:hypothetical protein